VGSLERLLKNKKTLTPFVGVGATTAVVPDDPCARWDGLLEDGIRACEELGQPAEWAAATAERLRFKDAITYLSVADEISRRLAQAGEWNDWIRRTVGRIKAPGNLAMHAAICKLNRIVLTTNYDLLLEEASDYETLYWKETMEVRRATNINEDRRAVIHLHGVATIPDSIILSSWQYQRLIDNEAVKFWQNVLLSRQLLFIGCGSGLQDPNIGPALEFVRMRSSPPAEAAPEYEPDEHYILVRGCDLRGALDDFRGSNIRPVAYGADYSELKSFLTELAAGREPTPSQNVHDYGTPPRSTPKHGLLDLAGPAEEALEGALDVVRRALQAVGQVERRSTLPPGVDRWSYADRLFIHERTAASVIGPIERLQTEVTALDVALQDMDAQMGLLTGREGSSLAGLFDLVNDLVALCEELSKRVTTLFTKIKDYSELTDEYRGAVTAMQEVRGLVADIRGIVERLPGTRAL
jgi:SIR2-like domain